MSSTEDATPGSCEELMSLCSMSSGGSRHLFEDQSSTAASSADESGTRENPSAARRPSRRWSNDGISPQDYAVPSHVVSQYSPSDHLNLGFQQQLTFKQYPEPLAYPLAGNRLADESFSANRKSESQDGFSLLEQEIYGEETCLSSSKSFLVFKNDSPINVQRRRHNSLDCLAVSKKTSPTQHPDTIALNSLLTRVYTSNEAKQTTLADKSAIKEDSVKGGRYSGGDATSRPPPRFRRGSLDNMHSVYSAGGENIGDRLYKSAPGRSRSTTESNKRYGYADGSRQALLPSKSWEERVSGKADGDMINYPFDIFPGSQSSKTSKEKRGQKNRDANGSHRQAPLRGLSLASSLFDSEESSAKNLEAPKKPSRALSPTRRSTKKP